eukprot:5700669-Prymnesium_polylepis.1
MCARLVETLLVQRGARHVVRCVGGLCVGLDFLCAGGFNIRSVRAAALCVQSKREGAALTS